MVKYWIMLSENPHIWLEVIKTLSMATLLLVDLGSLEHDCLEVMDEVFMSQTHRSDQLTSHLDI
jgi:hypothetical protein